MAVQAVVAREGPVILHLHRIQLDCPLRVLGEEDEIIPGRVQEQRDAAAGVCGGQGQVAGDGDGRG